ncbi:hypothetical protein BJ912DRAFT_926719 [Pholiota molesta]|nr:hypothetical protein BJ912DRAFT_926719 [Pholiota molesta]
MSSTNFTCPFPGSPPLNTDIAGIGVRISTYVQSFLTIVSLTLSPDMDKVFDQSFPFIIMNISVMVAALVLGFSPSPQISLQDGLIAWFFTFIPIFVLTIVDNKLMNRNKLYSILKLSNWDLAPNGVARSIMYILHAAFSLALFHHYKTFGSQPGCNNAARAFIFGTHAVTNRWFIGLSVAYGIVLFWIFIPKILSAFLIVIFVVFVGKPRNDEERQEAARHHENIERLRAQVTPEANLKADYRWGFLYSSCWRSGLHSPR